LDLEVYFITQSRQATLLAVGAILVVPITLLCIKLISLHIIIIIITNFNQIQYLQILATENEKRSIP
jgi:hypothetical protein